MTNPLQPSSLLQPLFSSAAMRAVTADAARLQRMLDFEHALARAEGSIDVIPASAIRPIEKAAKAERYDIAALAEASIASGNLAIPLVKALTAEVATIDPEAAGYVHWGATSQDMIDTALVLELRAGIDVLMTDLDRAIVGFTNLTGKYRRTQTIARTWLQQALPMPFGLKLAGYAGALARARDRLRRLRRDALVLQFGGAAGTLAALGARGVEVSERLAAELDLPLPDAPWHTHRDRLGEVAAALGILSGTCGKIARDVSLLMQTEIGEAFEPSAPGRGGSSTMPHKRNPTASAAALACAHIAPQLVATILAAEIQEHERSAGAWAAEWPTFPALLLVVSGALRAIVDISEGLEADGDRMRQNLDLTRGQIMAESVSFALAAKVGKAEAHKIIEEGSRKAVAEKRHLEDVLKQDERVKAQLSDGELARAFEPTMYQGVSQIFIERTIASLNLPSGMRSRLPPRLPVEKTEKEEKNDKGET